jgi:hypothetical protein
VSHTAHTHTHARARLYKSTTLIIHRTDIVYPRAPLALLLLLRSLHARGGLERGHPLLELLLAVDAQDELELGGSPCARLVEPGRGRCVSIFLFINRRYVGKSQSKRISAKKDATAAAPHRVLGSLALLLGRADLERLALWAPCTHARTPRRTGTGSSQRDANSRWQPKNPKKRACACGGIWCDSSPRSRRNLSARNPWGSRSRSGPCALACPPPGNPAGVHACQPAARQVSCAEAVRMSLASASERVPSVGVGEARGKRGRGGAAPRSTATPRSADTPLGSSTAQTSGA